MKLRKLQLALKKAHMAETLATAAYNKTLHHAQIVHAGWLKAKATYKAARKELKKLRKEVVRARAAHKAAARGRDQSAIVLQKLGRKLKKMEKKGQQRPPVHKRAKKSSPPVIVKRTRSVQAKARASVPTSASIPLVAVQPAQA